MVTISRVEYEEYLELKKQNEWLLEQLRVIRNRQFGSSSEKASEEVYEQLSLLFDEAEAMYLRRKKLPLWRYAPIPGGKNPARCGISCRRILKSWKQSIHFRRKTGNARSAVR